MYTYLWTYVIYCVFKTHFAKRIPKHYFYAKIVLNNRNVYKHIQRAVICRARVCVYVYYYAPSVIYYFSRRGIAYNGRRRDETGSHPHAKDNGGKHCHLHNTITIILRLYYVYIIFFSPSSSPRVRGPGKIFNFSLVFPSHYYATYLRGV